jgi:hypothetical protein
MSREMTIVDHVFHGQYIPPADGATATGPFVKTITGAAPPTVLGVSGGGVALALTATNEAQNVCLSYGDVLSIPAARLCWAEFFVKLTASLAADVIASWGLATARADDPTAISAFALFQCNGDNNLDIDTDDNVIDNGAKATGLTIAATRWQKTVINFVEGYTTISPPSQSLGSLSNVLFRADDARGKLKTLVENFRFDMSGLAALNLQPYAQIQKTAGTSVGTLTIERIRYAFWAGDE